jgi:hypothetical protein
MKPYWLLPILLLAGCGKQEESKSIKAVDDAYRVCAAFTGTKLTTECTVHAGARSIDVRIDTSGEEARKMCAGSVEKIGSYTANLHETWKLQIFSPFSGDHPMAVCQF